jgi:hypothetical protein
MQRGMAQATAPVPRLYQLGPSTRSAIAFGCRIAFSFSGVSQVAHRDLTPWLGWEDSNSGIRARAM